MILVLVAVVKSIKLVMEEMQINKYIDHTVLKPTCLVADIQKLCSEAKQYDFAAVCVPPNFVKLAKELVAESDVKVATVIGFPFGYCATEAKIAEIILAMVDGADELDVVANISAIKNGDWSAIADEINHIMPIIRSKGKTVKIIIESGVLTDDEIIKCCDIYGIAGIDFLKTSTGYAEKGASVEAVQLFRKHLPESVHIKASGGIRDYATAKQMIDAGATRIGCSAGVAIVSGASTENIKSNY
jgi:deoxyribose-phosphate aldolase